MGEALLVLAPTGEIKSANPAACRMLDYAEQDLLGMAIGDVFEEEADETAGAFMGMWLEALIRVGALSQIDARLIAKDDRRVPILFSSGNRSSPYPAEITVGECRIYAHH